SVFQTGHAPLDRQRFVEPPEFGLARRITGSLCLFGGNLVKHLVRNRIDEPRAKKWWRVALRFDQRQHARACQLDVTPIRALFASLFGFRFVFWKDGCFPLGELRTNSKAMEGKGRLHAQGWMDFSQLALRRNLEFDFAARLAPDDLLRRISRG